MNALIVYDSKFGNTERIARAIAERLGSARLIRAEEAGALGRTKCDLLIVAGPTQRHGASTAMQEWLEGQYISLKPKGGKTRQESSKSGILPESKKKKPRSFRCTDYAKWKWMTRCVNR